MNTLESEKTLLSITPSVTCNLITFSGGGGGIHRSFDVDSFSREFVDVLSHGGGDSSPCCRIEYKAIVMETYVGLTSLLHNSNDLGFYKVRGRVSF